MARLISCATGNLTAAGSWALVDSTSLLDNENTSTQLTTSYVNSSTFTPGAITIDGIAVKLSSVSSSPSGTISVALDQGGGTVVGTEVTLNVSDLPTMITSTTTNEGGWILFKFAAPVLLLAATLYSVKAKTSGATQVGLWRDGTSNNWNRQLRTTTTQAPVAGDVMHIIGEHTGAGTGNDFTITMDETATTDYGAGTDGVPALTVGKRGTLNYAYAAATNYYLKLSGDAIIYNGGTFTVGTVANPIPRDSTAVLEFDPVADGGMGLIARNGSTVTMQGLSRSSGKDIVYCKLNTDEAVNSTSLGVDTDTGWLDNDEIVVTKTTRIASNLTEAGALNGNAGASTLTVDGFAGAGGGLANAHLGTAPTQAHVGLLTRNVKFRSATSTIMTYFNAKATSTVDMDWCEFRYIGENATGKRGIEIENTTGSFSMQYCSMVQVEDNGIYTNGSAVNNVTISNNVFHGLNSAKPAAAHGMTLNSTSGIITVTNNLFSGCAAASSSLGVVGILTGNAIFSNNIIGGTISSSSLFLATTATLGTMDNNEIYGSEAPGIFLNQTGMMGTMSNLKVWFCSSSGFNINANVYNFYVNDGLFFGNSGQNVALFQGGVTFNRCKFNSFSGTTTTNAVLMSGNITTDFVFNDCTFSEVSGSYVACTNDINLSTQSCFADLYFINCLFGAATLITGYQTRLLGSARFVKHNQTANKHFYYNQYGIIQSTGSGLTDTTVRTSGSLGVRMAPNNASNNLMWQFNILAKASSIVNFMGFFQKNAAFGTDVAKVELWLPGSTVADDTFTLADNTDWQACVLSANYTGTVDLLATIKVYAKSATAAAYLYCDDFYNAGTSNKIAGLDTWELGLPVDFIVDTVFDPSSVWSYDTTNLTTANTTGNQVKKLLTTAKFLGLK